MHEHPKHSIWKRLRALDPYVFAGSFVLVATALSPLVVGINFFSAYIFVQVRFFYIGAVLLTALITGVIIKSRRIPFMPYLRLLTPWFFLIIALAISGITGINPLKSLLGTWERFGGTINWLLLFAFSCCLFWLLDSRAKWILFWKLTVAVAALVSFIGIAQGIGYSGVFFTGERVFSTLGNPGFMASYLLLAAGITFFQMRSVDATRSKIVYAVILSLQLVAIALSGTRAAYLALAMMLCVIAISYLCGPKVAYRNHAPVIVVIALFFLSLGGVFVAQPQRIEGSIGRIKDAVAFDQTVRDRIYVWDIALRGFLERPLLGWGENNFIVVFQRYYNPALYRGETQSTWYDRAHSELFERMSAGGLLGLAVYLIWAAVPLVLFLKLARSDSRFTILAATCAGYFVYLLFYFHSIADTMLFVALYAFSVYSVYAANAAGERVKKLEPKTNILNQAFYGWQGAILCMVVGLLACVYAFGPGIRDNYRVKQTFRFVHGEGGGFFSPVSVLPPQGLRALVGDFVPLVHAQPDDDSIDALQIDMCRAIGKVVEAYPHEVRWWLIQATTADDCFPGSSFDVAIAALDAAQKLAPHHPQVYHTAGFVFFNKALNAASDRGALEEYARASSRSFSAAHTLTPDLTENEFMQMAAQALIDQQGMEELRLFVEKRGSSFDAYTHSLAVQVAGALGDAELLSLVENLRE